MPHTFFIKIESTHAKHVGHVLSYLKRTDNPYVVGQYSGLIDLARPLTLLKIVIKGLIYSKSSVSVKVAETRFFIKIIVTCMKTY